MGQWTKRGLIGLGLVIGALASGLVGGAIGFLQGYDYGLGDTAVRAVTLTGALRSIRGGRTDEGIAKLESNLDTLIVEHWARNRDGPPTLAWLVRAIGDPSAERTLFAAVARYRAEYPTTTPVPQVREIITSHLRTFEMP